MVAECGHWVGPVGVVAECGHWVGPVVVTG